MLSKKKGVAHVMQEFDILRSAAHPFVIKLYASFQSSHHLCHLMEFCPRGHFYSLLQSQPYKRLPEAAARFYGAEILSGIEYLHIQGFIYRDMKPENILVAASGHLRLTDFDLSQTADDAVTHIKADSAGIGVSQKVHDLLMAQQEHEASTMAVGGASNKKSTAASLNYARFDSFVGTIEYMAPEVVQGTGHSFTVDWWIYGCMLYEMVTGVTPFRGKDAKTTFEKILYSEPAWTHPLCLEPRPKVSKELKDIIKKLLTKEQSKRLGYDQGAAAIKKQPWFNREITIVGTIGHGGHGGHAGTNASTAVSSGAVAQPPQQQLPLPQSDVTSKARDVMSKVWPVRWDLLRNERPPMLPQPKAIEQKVGQTAAGSAVIGLKSLEEVFDQLDREEREQLAKKQKADQTVIAAAGGAAPAPAAQSKAELDPAQTRAKARADARTAAANAPERLVGFVFDSRDHTGKNDRRDAYGADETGTAKLLATMADEAHRRAAARLVLSVPFDQLKHAVVVDPRALVTQDYPSVAGGVWNALGLTLGPPQASGGGLVIAAIEPASSAIELQPSLTPGCQLASVQGVVCDAFEEGEEGKTTSIEAAVLAAVGQAVSQLKLKSGPEAARILELVFLTAAGAEAEARQQARLRMSVSARQSRQSRGAGGPEGISFADVIQFDEEKGMAEALAMLVAGQYQPAGRAFAAVLRMTESLELMAQAKRGLEQARKGVALAMLSPDELMAMLPAPDAAEATEEMEDDEDEDEQGSVTLHDHLGLAPLEGPESDTDQPALASSRAAGSWFGWKRGMKTMPSAQSPPMLPTSIPPSPGSPIETRRKRTLIPRLPWGNSAGGALASRTANRARDDLQGVEEDGMRMSFDGPGESGVRMSFDSDGPPPLGQ